jgi:thiol:disulfide interchange protein
MGRPRTEYLRPQTSIPAQPSSYQNYPPPATEVVPPPAGVTHLAVDRTAQQVADAKRKGILNFLLLSFGFGLAALLTPCVFPMIPITVSFFAKADKGPGSRTDLRGAFAYSIGIIGTFTGLGLLMTAVFGPAGLNRLAQSPWTNLVLAALFITLAANLFGAFEIVLPSWMLDKAQEGKGRGGWLGPMAMGFAFTLTSFTCTVAFVGTLLAAAAQGDWFYPAIGMLAFSTAFALPFFLLALFPQFLGQLPRSGSWMISVKAFMGFLELAAALKFLSNIDLFLQRGLLTRSVFLAMWAGIAIVAGLYLWGWLRLSVDTSKRFGVARRTIGAMSVVAGLWCLAAINGAPLGTLAAFLPPEPYPFKDARGTKEENVERDWDSARARAAAEHKPIFINFTGALCTNCRDMENNVFPQKEVKRELDRFVRVDLITDQFDARSTRNQGLQDKFTHVVTLPYYVIASSDGNPIGTPTGYTKDTAYFVQFLREGYAAAQKAR